MASPLRYFRSIVKEVSRNRLPENRRKRRRLLMEPLERRVLLAADNLASIAGTAFIDGLADTPLESATVDLYRDGGDGLFDRGAAGGDDALVGTATTDASGAYRFDNLTADTYFVEQQAFSGLLQRPGEEVQTIIITDLDAAGQIGLVIDSFGSTTQLVEDPTDMLPNASAVDVAPGEAVGGERDLFVENQSGSGRARLSANDLSSGFIELTMSSGTLGRGVATWDGDDDDSGVLDHTGLAGIDLTEGGINTAFRLAVGADHSGVMVTLSVYTDSGNWSSHTFAVADTGSATPDTGTLILVDFSEFVIQSGVGADLTDVGAVQLEIEGVVDVQVGIDDLGMIGPTVMSADFANLEPLSLGDLVWLDENNSGTFDAGEAGIGGVIVNLYEDTNVDNNLTPGTDFLLDTATTDSSGLYLFENLFPGDYVVQIDTANFGVAGALATFLDSTGNDPAPDPDDNDSNVDDNGLMLVDNGVVTRAVTLEADTEPTTDGDSDANTNLSVDFGFTPASDLLVLKSDDTDPVWAGSQLIYTLHVTNNGPSPVTGVTVIDTLPGEVFFQSATPDQGTAVHDAGVVTVDVGELGAGVTVGIDIVVTVDPATTVQSLLNTAVVFGENYDPDSSNNTVQESTAVERRIDLAITKSDSTDPVIAGETLIYTLQVTNNGPSDASGVTVTDELPDEVTFVTGISDQGLVAETDGIVTVDIGDLAAGADPVEITITVIVDPANRSTLLNDAAVSGTELDIDDTNNFVQEPTAVESQIDLAVDKVGAPATVAVGGQIVYTLQVTNNGPSEATGVTVTDNLPSGVQYVSGTSDQGTVTESGGIVTIDVGDLASDADPVEITITVLVEPTDDDTRLNEAEVDGFEPETDETNNIDSAITNVTPVIDLAIEKTASSTSVAAGDQLVYTLLVTNNGPSDATGVTVTDELPAGVQYVSGSSDQGTVSESGGIVTVDVGALDAGADPIEITITVDVDPSHRAALFNEAEVEGDQEESNLNNNTDTLETPVVVEVDLAIIKADSPDPVVAGQELTYTLSVVNNGVSDATGVIVTDELPDGLVYRSAVTTVGTVSETGGTVTVDIGDLASGASVVITIEVDVDPSVRDTITNTAQVDSTEPDTFEDNNEDDQPTTVQANVDLAVTKADSDDPVIAGQQLTYSLTVTNNGPSDATGVVLTDQLPDGAATFVSADSSQGTFTESGGVVTFSLGDLAVGADATATIVVEVDAAFSGTMTNEATVESEETELDSSNNTALEPTVVDELLSSIDGFVYYDGDDDGEMDLGEPGLPGVVVRLFGVDVEGKSVSLEAVTDEDGFYHFEDLRAGLYRLVEEHPDRFIDGRETIGSLAAILANNDEFSDIDLPGGVEAKDYLFGERALPFSKRRFLSSS